jgi:hypothetical protein
MRWLLVTLAAVLAAEAFARLPLFRRFRGIVDVSRKSARVLSSRRISDHWKERVLPAYSLRLGRDSVVFFLLLCAALLPVAVVGLAYPGGLSAWGAFLMDLRAILLLCAVSIGWLWVRARFTRV